MLRIKCLQCITYLFESLSDVHQPQFFRQVKYYQLKSAVETAQCLQIHRQSYGLKHIPSEIVKATQTGLRNLVHPWEDSDEIRQAFIEFCRFGRALGHRFKQTADVIQEIRKTAMRQGLQLPPEAIAILDDPEQWSTHEM